MDDKYRKPGDKPEQDKTAVGQLSGEYSHIFVVMGHSQNGHLSDVFSQ